MPKTIIKYSLLKQFLDNGSEPTLDMNRLLDNILLDAAEQVQENAENLKQHLDTSSGNKSKIEEVVIHIKKLSRIAENIKEALESGKDLKHLVRQAHNVFANIWSRVGGLGLKKEEAERARDFVNKINDALRTLTAYAYRDVIQNLRREIGEQLSGHQPPHTP